MKNILLFLVLSAVMVLMNESCKHDPVIPDEIIIPIETGNCNPDTVYFERDVLPILKSNCALSGCHNSITKEKGIDFSNYLTTLQTADITPFQPGESEVIKVINETDPDDIMPPPPAAPLSQAQIAIITKWMQQGAKNWVCDEGVCDTTSVLFSTTISPIIQNTCSGCHAAVNPQGGLSLTNHAQISTIALDGRLINSLLGQNGFMLMPQGGPSLPDCEIAQIQIWVSDGAPDN